MLLSIVEPAFESTGPGFSSNSLRELCWTTLGVTLLVLVFYVWFDFDARNYLRTLWRQRREQNLLSGSGPEAPWSELEEKAQWVIDQTLTKLPPPTRSEAETVPIVFEERRKTEDGRVVLGLYRGFTEGWVSDAKGPIVLYLRNIEQYCIESGKDFQEEVDTTYLHELGHHFGWGEKEVEERGL